MPAWGTPACLVHTAHDLMSAARVSICILCSGTSPGRTGWPISEHLTWAPWSHYKQYQHSMMNGPSDPMMLCRGASAASYVSWGRRLLVAPSLLSYSDQRLVLALLADYSPASEVGVRDSQPAQELWMCRH